jgi:hypothetical protein
LTISNGYVTTSSHASNYGAAVYIGGSSAVRMTSVTITSCRVASSGSGGAVYVEFSSLAMVDSVMSSNYAYYGSCVGAGDSSEVSLIRVAMSSNTGVSGGGYYTTSSAASLSMTGCTMDSHSLTSGSGGGIYIGTTTSSMALNMTDCALTSNSVSSGNRNQHSVGVPFHSLGL